MSSVLKLTDEERAQIQREIDYFFMFTEDVLADPSILNQMPDEAEIDPIPKNEREPGRRYDVESERMVITVTPIRKEELAMHNGQHEAG